MVMQVRIMRDERVAPGGEGVVELPGELLFVVSAAGVTQEGADSLEYCWRWFIERGLWVYRGSGGAKIETTYHLLDLGAEAAARVSMSDWRVDCWCSTRHFTRGSVNGLEAAARASVRRGWRYHETSRVRSSRVN